MHFASFTQSPEGGAFVCFSTVHEIPEGKEISNKVILFVLNLFLRQYSADTQKQGKALSILPFM